MSAIADSVTLSLPTDTPSRPAEGWPLISLLGILLIPLIFALDLALPLGYAGGMPYVVPVLLGLWVRRPAYVVTMALIATAMTVLGYVVSTPGAAAAWIVIINRALAVAATWITAFGLLIYLGAARQLERSEAHHRAILDTAIDGIITIAPDGSITAFNPAAEKIFGYASDQVVGRNVKVLVPPPERESHDHYIEAYLRSGDAKMIGIGREASASHKDGTRFPIDLAVTEIKTADSHFFTAMIRDITATRKSAAEREALIDQLEQKNAELERFTYTVSHDLKSPLVTIKGFLGSIEKDAREGNMRRLRADIGRIGNAADRMRQLLDDLLRLSRIGRITQPPEYVALGELATETVQHIQGLIESHGAQVVIADQLPIVWGDRLRLGEVLQNLIENGIKFAADVSAPRVEIGVRTDGDEPVIFVRDNGVGIEPRYLERVFGLFEQLERGGEGSGIGLALAKRIVHVHGGRLWAESDGPGLGACFCFTLPAGPDLLRPGEKSE